MAWNLPIQGKSQHGGGNRRQLVTSGPREQTEKGTLVLNLLSLILNVAQDPSPGDSDAHIQDGSYHCS